MDGWNYLLFNNPVSSTVISGTKKTLSIFLKDKKSAEPVANVPAKVIQELAPLYQQCGKSKWIIRIAGISGAAAVILGAYGAHKQFPDSHEKNRDLKGIFDTANRYHFYHTFGLLALPLAKRPLLTGGLMTSGMVLFCGTCYYASLTDDQRFNRLAPLGGLTLILAWISLIF